jgi:hypothetical protein
MVNGEGPFVPSSADKTASAKEKALLSPALSEQARLGELPSLPFPHPRADADGKREQAVRIGKAANNR